MTVETMERTDVSWFDILLNAETKEYVPARLIRTQYGLCWALVDGENKFTGKFISAFPARKTTMLKKGYVEAEGLYKFYWNKKKATVNLPMGEREKGCDDNTPPLKIREND